MQCTRSTRQHESVRLTAPRPDAPKRRARAAALARGKGPARVLGMKAGPSHAARIWGSAPRHSNGGRRRGFPEPSHACSGRCAIVAAPMLVRPGCTNADWSRRACLKRRRGGACASQLCFSLILEAAPKTLLVEGYNQGETPMIRRQLVLAGCSNGNAGLAEYDR